MAPFVSQILHPEDEQRRSFEEKIIILPQAPSSASRQKRKPIISKRAKNNNEQAQIWCFLVKSCNQACSDLAIWIHEIREWKRKTHLWMKYRKKKCWRMFLTMFLNFVNSFTFRLSKKYAKIINNRQLFWHIPFWLQALVILWWLKSVLTVLRELLLS